MRPRSRCRRHGADLKPLDCNDCDDLSYAIEAYADALRDERLTDPAEWEVA